MANKRHKPEEIVQKLRQVDVLVVQGVQRMGAIREVSITCPSSDNLGQLSVVSFGGSGSSLLEVMRFQFGGASAA